MNKFECINTFIQVVEEHSFARAAKKQRLSAAAISRQIATLENALGVVLLRRTTRKLSLTEVGQTYYQQCKKTLQDLKTAEEAVLGSQKEAVGLLHVMSNKYFAKKYVLPRLSLFMKENPKLQIKLELGERFPDLAEENIDLVFGISMKGPSHLIQRQVATTRYVLCASPEYLKRNGVPQQPQDLLQHVYITHSMRVPDNLIRFKNDQEVIVQPTLWLNDSRAMIECALQGIGIAGLHDYMVHDRLAQQQLIEILPTYQLQSIPVFLYYQQSKHLQPKIRKFIDFFVS